MVVTEDATFGTIGGGQLEYEALRSAREMLTGGAAAAQLSRFGLGPSLGQCCGGTAQVLFEPTSEATEGWLRALVAYVDRGEPAVLVTALGAAADGKLVVSREGAVGTFADPQRQAAALAGAGAAGRGGHRAASRADGGPGGTVRAGPPGWTARRAVRRRACRQGAGPGARRVAVPDHLGRQPRRAVPARPCPPNVAHRMHRWGRSTPSTGRPPEPRSW